MISTLEAVTLSDWISAFAAITACGSAIFAYSSYRIARQSLGLSTQVFDRSQPNSSVYLIDAFRCHFEEQKVVLYVFSLSITNRSTIQNTIVSVEMRLPFVRDGVERLGVFTHKSSEALVSINNVLQLPAEVPPRGALVTNCCFEVPDEMLERAECGFHLLRIRYVEGTTTEIEPKVIMDVVDVQHLEKKRQVGVPI